MPSQILSNDSHSNSTAPTMSFSTLLPQPLQMDLHPFSLSISQQPMSLYLTIYSNALQQIDYRLTQPASLLHKLLHRLLYQFSRSQRRPNHAADEFTLHLRVPTPYKQPMSLLSMTSHVTERMSNAFLCCRPRSPRAPKSSTYQSVLFPTTQPYKPLCPY
jgi:hypothetical protein